MEMSKTDFGTPLRRRAKKASLAFKATWLAFQNTWLAFQNRWLAFFPAPNAGLSRLARGARVAALTLAMAAPALTAASAARILIEAEAFASKGGWTLNQQFMDQMGSPYLIAHGMGRPVADATATFTVPDGGTYNIYVRTYNWTSPWHSGKGPGKFAVIIDGRKTSVAGDSGTAWGWAPVGKARLKGGTHAIALRDLTGFDGRCDAIYLTSEAADTPPQSPTAAWRESLNPHTATSQSFDFVVVGGGVAGMCAAVAAARLGLKTALVNDRPLWGGNNSSDIRVHLSGKSETGAYPALGRLLREFGPVRGGNAAPAENYEDAKKEKFLRGEKNLTLFPSYHANAVGRQGDSIVSVTIQHIESGDRIVLSAPLFADCTGDATVGVMAGADWRMGREGKAEFHESFAPDEPDSTTMGASVQWYSVEGREKFPEFDYGMGFNDENCEQVTMGEWTWETGLNRNQITQAEQIRDYGMLAVYANWSWLKNHSARKAGYAGRKLGWVSCFAGKRESRRLMGDYILKEDDILKDVFHEDASFATTWSIDLHFPDSANHIHFPGREFKAFTNQHALRKPYDVPYRCLYSRNVGNLFMAGRDISVTHVALGSTRVMRTGGMQGEVVGMAAFLCHKYGIRPRGVYQHHLPELKDLMRKGTGNPDAPATQNYNFG